MKIIQDGSAFLFIGAVWVLSIISILGVWEVFQDDVISKSFQTMGLLALISIVAMIAARFVESRAAGTPAEMPNPLFKAMRHATIGVLIAAISILALLGVMAIWEVADGDVLYKALGSVGILAFGTFVVVVTCLGREKMPALNSNAASFSVGGTLLIVFLGLVVLSLMGSLF